jgi:uncharacterized protein involved in exopolysaccharide biosynthesis
MAAGTDDLEDHTLVSLRDISHVIFRYKQRVLLTIGTALLAAVAYLLYVDTTYEAEVKLLVLLGREEFSAMEAYNNPDFSVVFQERGENIANEMEIIQDKEIAHRVVQRFKEEIASNINPNPSPWQRFKTSLRETWVTIKDTVKWPLYKLGLSTRLTEDQLLLLELKNSLHVEFLEVTDIIRATFRAKNPEVAAWVLNTYVQEYLNHRMQVMDSSTSREFYGIQLDLYRDKLTEAEQALENFRSEVDISSLSMRRDLVLQQMSNLQNQYYERERERSEIKMTRRAVQSALERNDSWIETPQIQKSVDFQALDQSYMELFAERQRLLNTYTPTSREVKSLDGQMKQLRQEKARNLLNFLTTRMDILEESLASYRAELDQHQESLRLLDVNERRLNELNRELDIVEGNYLDYARKSEQLRISNDLTEHEIGSVRVISPAVAPIIPASPKKKLILALAAFLGLVLGLFYVVVARFFDHTFRTAADIERELGLPLLASFAHRDGDP